MPLGVEFLALPHGGAVAHDRDEFLAYTRPGRAADGLERTDRVARLFVAIDDGFDGSRDGLKGSWGWGGGHGEVVGRKE